MTDNQKQLNEQFFKAIENNNLKELKKLLKQGANPNAVTTGNVSILHYIILLPLYEPTIARIINSCKFVKELIKAGADVNASDLFGYTPLQLSIMYDNIKVFRLLKKAGANIDAKNKSGLNVLHYALKSNNPTYFRSLVRADVNLISPDNIGPHNSNKLRAFNRARKRQIKKVQQSCSQELYEKFYPNDISSKLIWESNFELRTRPIEKKLLDAQIELDNQQENND